MIDIVQQRLIADGIAEAQRQIKDLQDRVRRKSANETLEEVKEILRNLMSLNEITPTQMEIKHHNLPKLLQAIPQMYRLLFEKKHIDFRVIAMTSFLQVSVDNNVFFRIFFNLVCYLGQYADSKAEGGSFIQVEAKPYNENLMAIYIEDNGSYPVGTHDNVFDKPYKKRVSNTIAGVGLGVVQEWVMALRGSIQLVDKLGPGIKCLLLLPSQKNEGCNSRIANAPGFTLPNNANGASGGMLSGSCTK